ncbi:OsmC family protein [Cellulomonas fimi]|uniref:OsmC family peroxiredoxin n=1 Tax=Cellulomonas fimi TaxID=1708 RepID=A0A7Y0M034_CELFI|nr:OsmC family protein [Cellulomonas fimi]NMR20914.1 OsmC family peroxiredoxin [Cellulomonas fimi]
MGALHSYAVGVEWTGAGATGTVSYTAYSRDHDVLVEGRPPLAASSDPVFRGDPTRHSPEQLFVASLAQCHMLWFLHLAAQDGVVVVGYTDEAVGTMRVESAGAGQFTEVVLHPRVLVRQPASSEAPVTDARLRTLHERAHDHCFIARSVNFPVLLEPTPVTPTA